MTSFLFVNSEILILNPGSLSGLKEGEEKGREGEDFFKGSRVGWGGRKNALEEES